MYRLYATFIDLLDYLVMLSAKKQFIFCLFFSGCFFSIMCYLVIQSSWQNYLSYKTQQQFLIQQIQQPRQLAIKNKPKIVGQSFFFVFQVIRQQKIGSI